MHHYTNGGITFDFEGEATEMKVTVAGTPINPDNYMVLVAEMGIFQPLRDVLLRVAAGFSGSASPNLTAKAAAKYLGVHENTLCLWRKNGVGPEHKRFGRRVVYPLKAVQEYATRSSGAAD